MVSWRVVDGVCLDLSKLSDLCARVMSVTLAGAIAVMSIMIGVIVLPMLLPRRRG